jgi:hypothetical protein
MPTDLIPTLRASDGGHLSAMLTRAASPVAVALPFVLAQTNVQGAALTGTVAETVLATITVPGGMMGPNGCLRIRVLASTTNNANNKTMRINLGGTAFATLTVASSLFMSAAVRIGNRASEASNMAANDAFNGGTGVVTTGATIDTAVDQALTLTGQLASAGDTMRIESVLVEVLPG